MDPNRDKDLRQTRKKDHIKTALLAGMFLLAAIVTLDYVIGDPSEFPDDHR